MTIAKYIYCILFISLFIKCNNRNDEVENNAFFLNQIIYISLSETLDWYWNYQIFHKLWHNEKYDEASYIQTFLDTMNNQLIMEHSLDSSIHDSLAPFKINLSDYILSCKVDLFNETGELIDERVLIEKINFDEIDILSKKYSFMDFGTNREDAYSFSKSWIVDFKYKNELLENGYYEHSEIFNNNYKISIYIFALHPELRTSKN